MPKIFISYRRDDSAYPAQSIHEKLVSHFGQEAVFFDVDSIPIGMDFHGILNDAVAECDVLLAVIGDHWLNAKDGAGNRRLDNPNDFVRIEIEAALSRDIPVVPVLVGRAMVPRAEQMPDSLRKLARRNAAEVRPGRDFRSHLDRLVQGIEHLAEIAERPAPKPASSELAEPTSKPTDDPLTEQPQPPIRQTPREPSSTKKQGTHTSRPWKEIETTPPALDFDSEYVRELSGLIGVAKAARNLPESAEQMSVDQLKTLCLHARDELKSFKVQANDIKTYTILEGDLRVLPFWTREEDLFWKVLSTCGENVRKFLEGRGVSIDWN